MKFELNMGKKHLYVASVIIALLALVVFAAGNSRNPGHPYDQLDLGPLVIGDTIPADTVEGNVLINGGIEAVGKSAISGAFYYYPCEVNWGDADEATCSCPTGSKFISGGYICSEDVEEQANVAIVDSNSGVFRVDCNGDDKGNGDDANTVDAITLVCAYNSISDEE